VRHVFVRTGTNSKLEIPAGIRAALGAYSAPPSEATA
jgi:hypothetical protein